MDSTKSYFNQNHSWALFLFITALGFCMPNRATALGVNYGQIANNLPNPSDAVKLVKSLGATKIKLYDADPKVLTAFADTGVEVMIGLGNEYLTRIQDPTQAQLWIKSNVQTYLPRTKITAIFVGNEVLTFNDTALSSNLLPAMKSIHDSLTQLNLHGQITVTTAHSLAILESSYPPSSGKFRRDLATPITQMLEFQSKIGSPFLINAYPYFAYKGNPKQIPLDFVLFQPNEGILDPETNLHYDNMLFAQMDAVHSALHDVGFGRLSVHISETGWPSKGDSDEAGATPENAKKYNGNLLKIICKRKGTPLRPNCDLNIYVFALFNENMKPGPTSERNYGLFKPDGSPVYSLGLSTGSSTSTGNGTSGNSPSGGSGPGLYPVTTTDDNSSSTGYLAISRAVSTVKDPLSLFPKMLAIFFLLIGLLL